MEKKKLAIIKKALRIHNATPQSDGDSGWSLDESLTDERTRMDIALGHHTRERRCDPKIAFHVANRVQRLPRRFDILLPRRDLSLIGLDRLLRQHDVIAGHHTRRRGGRFMENGILKISPLACPAGLKRVRPAHHPKGQQQETHHASGTASEERQPGRRRGNEKS